MENEKIDIRPLMRQIRQNEAARLQGGWMNRWFGGSGDRGWIEKLTFEEIYT
jgi:hypothetical protein